MPAEIDRIVRGVQSKAVIASERFMPQIKLEVTEEATLDSARDLDVTQGKYKDSANHYYSVAETTRNPEVRAEATIGLAQELINLGNLGQARGILENISFQEIGDDRRRSYFAARQMEKLGWIADAEGNFQESENRFKAVGTFVSFTPESQWTDDERKLYLTSIHFMGRASFGQGRYADAIVRFGQHAQNEGMNKDEYAYDHAWMARCYMKLGKNYLGQAEKEVKIAEQLFIQHATLFPEKGIMSKWYLVEGELLMKKGQFGEARYYLELARSMDHERDYRKGEATASYAIAFTYWAQRQYGAAFKYALSGAKTYPLSLIKPAL